MYDGIKSRFGEAPTGETTPTRHVYPAAQAKGYQPIAREHPWSLHILSAMTAGATSTICTNPLWVIKTRFMVRSTSNDGILLSMTCGLQTQPFTERRYRHTLDAILTIYQTEGWRAFFRGLLPSLFGIMHVAVQFPLYEQLKTWSREYSVHRARRPIPQLFSCCQDVERKAISLPNNFSCAPPFPK